MRILLVYDQLNTGGTEKLFVMMANLLHRNGQDVRVVILKEAAALDFELATAIPIVYLHRKNKFSPFKMLQLSKECKKADIIHLHSYYNWRYFYISSIIFRMGKGRMILQEHSDMKNLKWIDKFVLPEIDAFIAVHPLQEYKAHEAGVSPNKIFLLPNIVQRSKKLKTASAKKNRFIMVGNIRREKYYQLAIEILRKLPASINIDIYGNINDREYYKELQQTIKEYGLQEQINFITGENNVEEHFHKYDLALHTANNETGPLVVLEYLAAGLPFLISSAGQSPALIARHNPKLVISSYNSNVWLQAIQNFYAMSADAQVELLGEMEATAERLLSAENYYSTLIEIYREAQHA